MRVLKFMPLLALAATMVGCTDDEKQSNNAPEKNIEISRAESESMSSIADFSIRFSIALILRTRRMVMGIS